MSNYSFKANPGIQTQRGTALSIQTVFTQIILLSRKLFTWDDLQQQHEFQPIPEVLLDVLNLRACFPQVGVTPSCKCLQTEKKRGREKSSVSALTHTQSAAQTMIAVSAAAIFDGEAAGVSVYLLIELLNPHYCTICWQWHGSNALNPARIISAKAELYLGRWTSEQQVGE